MSVDTKHKLYKASGTNWKFMRDCIEGDSAIKTNGKTYVPILNGQTDAEYKAYIGRPYFEGYTQRVLDGLTGLLYSKTPTVEAPKQLEDLFDNFDLNGSTLTDYTQDLSSETIGIGRVGALIDNTTDESNNRPFATIYKTETIKHWKHLNINGAKTLVMVVLEENEEIWTDMFTSENQVIYRVLVLSVNEGATAYTYEQQIYRPDGDNTYSIVPSEVITPLMNGKPLTYIPFVAITPEKLVIEPAKPPLLDLARVNVAHFKLNVDYYHGMHFTALPTPYGVGIQEKQDTTFSIGSTAFNFYSNPQAKLSYLEFEGKGLETLENEKSKLVDAMVVLGSNMLQGDKKTAEAEATVAMRSAGQNASLISTADTISRGVTKILQIMAEWMGATGNVSYKLNTDYNLTDMSPQMMKELIAGKSLGAIPLEVVYNNLVKGEIIDAKEISFEQYKEMIESDIVVPTESALTTPTNNDIDMESFSKSVGAK